MPGGLTLHSLLLNDPLPPSGWGGMLYLLLAFVLLASMVNAVYSLHAGLHVGLLACLFVCLFICLINQLTKWLIFLIRPDLFGRKKVLLIFGGLWQHDHGHDNLTGVDSTPVNCGEDNLTGVDSTQDALTGLTLHSLLLNDPLPPSGWGAMLCIWYFA